MQQQGQQAVAQQPTTREPIAGVQYFLDSPGTLDISFMNQALYVYVGANQTLFLPEPTPCSWVTVQNSTWTTTGSYSLTINGATLWTGADKVLSNGQFVRYTAMDQDGIWLWAEV